MRLRGRSCPDWLRVLIRPPLARSLMAAGIFYLIARAPRGTFYETEPSICLMDIFRNCERNVQAFEFHRGTTGSPRIVMFKVRSVFIRRSRSDRTALGIFIRVPL